MKYKGENLKNDIVECWTESADGYSWYIQQELNCFKRKAWTDMILENETRTKMKILDIGTGPGFFTIILSEKGHSVTGIDCTEHMIQNAKRNAQMYKADVNLQVMDSHELTFEDNSFDMIVTRNVTWTLYNPEKAYKEWKRVLKPNGKLIIFDANWQLSYFDEKLKEKVEEAKRKYISIYGEPFESSKKKVSEEFYKIFPLSKEFRPNWDEAKLKELGYRNISIDLDITQNVYDEKEKLLYGCTALFKITAYK